MHHVTLEVGDVVVGGRNFIRGVGQGVGAAAGVDMIMLFNDGVRQMQAWAALSNSKS